MMLLSLGELLELSGHYVANVEPALVTAICLQESGGNPVAVRYEPGYRWISKHAEKPNICTKETEVVLQSMSWGLMQIMGATARDLGFTGWLTELLTPEVNLLWGCAYLEQLTSIYNGVEDVVAAYNAGSPRRGKNGQYVNQPYVDSVLVRMEKVREVQS